MEIGHLINRNLQSQQNLHLPPAGACRVDSQLLRQRQRGAQQLRHILWPTVAHVLHDENRGVNSSVAALLAPPSPPSPKKILTRPLMLTIRSPSSSPQRSAAEPGLTDRTSLPLTTMPQSWKGRRKKWVSGQLRSNSSTIASYRSRLFHAALHHDTSPGAATIRQRLWQQVLEVTMVGNPRDEIAKRYGATSVGDNILRLFLWLLFSKPVHHSLKLTQQSRRFRRQ